MSVPHATPWLTASPGRGVNRSRCATETTREFESPSRSVSRSTSQVRVGESTLTVANGESAIERDIARRSRAVGDLQRSPRSRASGAGVNHRALRVAFNRRRWLPEQETERVLILADLCLERMHTRFRVAQSSAKQGDSQFVLRLRLSDFQSPFLEGDVLLCESQHLGCCAM